MTRRWMKCWFQAAVAAVLIAQATLTRGDDPGPLEVAVATGYVHGFGSVSGRMPELQHLAGGGGALHVEASWRLDPRWSVGAYYEGALYAGGHVGTEGMTGHAAGAQGQLHLSPTARLDPWLGVGFGWRGAWLDHGQGTHVLHGLDLARVQVGVDWRVSSRFSFAPTVGVSMTQFLKEQLPGTTASSDIADRKISAFLFAGVAGRFDVLGGAPERG